MLILALLLCAAGATMLARPAWVWQLTEQWKSDGADGPSDLYRLSIRFGGLLVILAGLATLAMLYLSRT